MVTRSTLMISNVMSTTVPEQPVEVELARELLRDVEQHRELLGLACLGGRGVDAKLARRPGASRLVMPAGTPPLTRSCRTICPAGGADGCDGRTLEPAGARRPQLEHQLAEGDGVVGLRAVPTSPACR